MIYRCVAIFDIYVWTYVVHPVWTQFSMILLADDGEIVCLQFTLERAKHYAHAQPGALFRVSGSRIKAMATTT